MCFAFTTLSCTRRGFILWQGRWGNDNIRISHRALCATTFTKITMTATDHVPPPSSFECYIITTAHTPVYSATTQRFLSKYRLLESHATALYQIMPFDRRLPIPRQCVISVACGRLLTLNDHRSPHDQATPSFAMLRARRQTSQGSNQSGSGLNCSSIVASAAACNGVDGCTWTNSEQYLSP